MCTFYNYRESCTYIYFSTYTAYTYIGWYVFFSASLKLDDLFHTWSYLLFVFSTTVFRSSLRGKKNLRHLSAFRKNYKYRSCRSVKYLQLSPGPAESAARPLWAFLLMALQYSSTWRSVSRNILPTKLVYSPIRIDSCMYKKYYLPTEIRLRTIP